MSATTSNSSELNRTRPRLHRFTIWITLVVFLVVSAAFFVYSMQALKRRSQQISIGMPRERVEEILGAPYLDLPKGPRGRGELLVWTDDFWQVDVVIDEDDQVVTYRCVPANSWYRITQSKLSSLLK